MNKCLRNEDALYYCLMAKGRTKNKRSRKPDRAVVPRSEIPKPYPVAYFTLPDKRHGYAEANSGGQFYHPSEPVTRFRITLIPNYSGLLEWSGCVGWSGDIRSEVLPYITPAIERSFSPLRYRFILNFG